MASAKKAKGNKRLSGERIVLLAYLWGVLLGTPLFMDDGYFNITAAKTLWFAVWTGLFLVIRAAQLARAGKLCFGKLRPAEICATALCVVALFSSIACGRFGLSFFGRYGRWQGAGMFLLYAALLLVFREAELTPRDVLTPLLAGLCLTSALAVIQHMGADPFALKRELAEVSRGRYMSTLGNTDLAGAYLSLTVPAALWSSTLSREKKETAALAAVSILGIWAMMAVRIDSVMIGLFFPLLLFPLWLDGDRGALLRWALLFPGIVLAMQAYRLLCLLSGAWLSDAVRLLLGPLPSVLLCALGAGLWFWFRSLPENALPRVRKTAGGVLLALFALGAAALVLLNTALRSLPLGRLDGWIRFSESWGSDRGMIWAYCLRIYHGFGLPEKLIGGGCGVLAMTDSAAPLFPDAVLDTAHSEYLQILLNWGAFGLAAYLGWIVFSWREGLRQEPPAFRALLAGTVGYAAQAAVNIAQTPGVVLFFVLLAVFRREKACLKK